MTVFCLINQANLTTTEMQILVPRVQKYADKVVEKWALEPVTVTDKHVDGGWNVYITTNNRRQNDAGYHPVEGGVPDAYCLPGTARNRFGTYRKPWIIRGRQIWGESFRPGLLTIICHEIAEMLIDPFGTRYSNKDSKYRTWLMEIGDHCFGGYFKDEQNYVYPDFTLPSFYDVNGVAPYTYLNAVKTPFTLTPKGYGVWLNPMTKQLIKL